MNNKARQTVLVIGATGMLGSAIFRAFSADENLKTYGTIRDVSWANYFSSDLNDALIPNINMNFESDLVTAFSKVNPNVVINCVGIIKQLPNANDYLQSLAINASLPHRLAKYCSMVGARLVHFSTDCVFSGNGGMYKESDFPDANDLYGRTKYLGEVDYENAVTLRTSIIGHELASNKSLVNWFLSQSGAVKGYRKAVFSGLPAIEIARTVKERVLPNPNLKGVYHLSVAPINKYDLLSLVAKIYGKDIKIIPDDNLAIDRSLNSDRFQVATGFYPKSWPDLIKDMYNEQMLTQHSNGSHLLDAMPLS